MRLDAREGDTYWNVFHVPTATQLRRVVWVDSSLALWGEIVYPYVLENGELRMRICSAKRIDILPHERLVMIDPVDDGETEETVAEAIDAIGSGA